MRRNFSAAAFGSFVIAAALVFTLGIGNGFAQTTAKPAAKAGSLTNGDVIKMVVAGLGEEIIIAKIQGVSDAKFDTSVDGLIALKSAKVSDNIIRVMMGGTPAANAAQTQTSAPIQVPAPAPMPTPVPAVQRHILSLGQTPTASADGIEAGIYVLGEDGKLTQLEPAVFNGTKTGGKFWASITSLAKHSLKVAVRSERSAMRLQTSVPVFYFYFENKGAGLSNTGAFTGFMNGASSPNEFVLTRMGVKKGERELVVGETWAFGDRAGVRSKDTVDFQLKKARTGVYEVKVSTPLTPGEYCFFYAAGNFVDHNNTGKLFDFGIDPGSAVTQ